MILDSPEGTAMNPAEWLIRTARLRPDAPALMQGETVLADYAEFARRVAVDRGGARDCAA